MGSYGLGGFSEAGLKGVWGFTVPGFRALFSLV